MVVSNLIPRLAAAIARLGDGPSEPFGVCGPVSLLSALPEFPPDPRCVDVELQRWAGVHHIVEHTCRDRNGAPCTSGRECWTRTRRESLRSYEVVS